MFLFVPHFPPNEARANISQLVADFSVVRLGEASLLRSIMQVHCDTAGQPSVKGIARL